MIRHITKLGLTIVVIVILIVIGIGGLTHDAAHDTMNPSKHRSHLKLKERIPSTHDGIDLFMKTEHTNTYTIDMIIPVTKSEIVNDEVEQWIEKEKQAFIDNILEDAIDQASFELSVVIEQESNHYDRFIFQVDIKKDKSEATQQKKVFNIDLEEGKVLSLNDFLNVNDQVLHSLLDKAIELLEQREEITIDENTRQAIHASKDSWEWFVNHKGLSVIFDGNAIAESKHMPLRIDMPFQALYLLVVDNIDTYIHLSDIQKTEIEVAIQKEEERVLEAKREQKKREQEKAEAKRKQEESTKPTHAKYVALTFDDGPSAEVTPRVLSILKEYNAKATFFMIGTQVDYYPHVAKQVADAGHEIANHTEQHQDLSKLGPAGIRQQVSRTSDKIFNATGVRPYLFRPPYGAYNKNVINDAANNGNSIILWSVDSLDWQSRNATAINREIEQTIAPGSIVLMHDIHSTTADALPQLMKTLQQDGYQFVTVSQLLDIQELNGVGPFYGHYK